MDKKMKEVILLISAFLQEFSSNFDAQNDFGKVFVTKNWSLRAIIIF